MKVRKVTGKERMMLSGRRWGWWAHGRVLTDDETLELRRRVRRGEMTYEQAARAFGVSLRTVARYMERDPHPSAVRRLGVVIQRWADERSLTLTFDDIETLATRLAEAEQAA